MRTRNWSIRSKIIALLMVPLITLVVLWGFATSLTLPPALNLLNAQTNSDYVGLPGEALVTALQRERMLSVVYLGGDKPVPALSQQRVSTDEAAAAFRERVTSEKMQDAASDLGRRRIAEVISALDLLQTGRGFIDRREVDRPGALGLYTGIIDSAFRLFATITALDDQDLARESRTLVALGRAQEVLAQENALVAGAFAAGRLAETEPSQIIQLIGTQRFLYAEAIAELPEPDRITYQRLTEERAFTDLRAMEDQLINEARAGAPVPVDAANWQRSYDAVSSAVREFELDQGAAVADHARPVAIATFLRLGVVSVLGLVAIVLTIIVSVRLGRSLIGRLTKLRQAALELASLRLPYVVAKLRRGEKIDVKEHAPPLEYGLDEIGQVGRAFTDVQRTAVQSAVDEAELRKGLSDVFLNIARRSQTLLHRQLALLDKMERRTTDPDEMDDLFRVDHLATRMRRHAEDLVILAGAKPGRGWRNPVPFVDIVRGAVSEVEDYARVSITMVEDAAVVGRAVGDVIHLLAELIENATSFSPPHTRVNVAGQVVPNGYAVEIEDRGLGMTPEAIADANERLASPPDFDPANSARLGLFVVAQLAARHGVRVELRMSPYGGVTAVALVPRELIVAAELGSPHVPNARQQPVWEGHAGRAGALPAGAAGRAEVLAPGERAGSPGEWTGRPEAADAAETVPIPLDRRARTISRLARSGLRPAIAPGAEQQPADPVPAEPMRGEPVAPQPAHGDVTSPNGAPSAPQLSPEGLPRRVRQANLARQLRDTPPPEPAVAALGPAGRSPEQIRAMMSSFQAGTVRGRRDATEDWFLPAG
ncbi:MAG TPA: nitrate- and nitrite sensing domain-containing protein, partial [Pilimelia sp.]|nr:nitrate- and nitrite sensing domain-containing protein [Pilimelia sp.]